MNRHSIFILSALLSALTVGCVAETAPLEDEAIGEATEAQRSDDPFGPWRRLKEFDFQIMRGFGESDLFIPGTAARRSRSTDTCRTVARAGTCEVERCEGPGVTEFEGVDAGVVTLSTRGRAPVEIAYDPEFGSYFADSVEGPWQPGRRYTLDIEGSTIVPAATVSVKLPNDRLTVLAPAAGSTPVVRRNREFVARWTPPDTPGTVTVEVLTFQAEDDVPGYGPIATDASRVACTYPASAGRGEIPSSILRHLRPSDDRAEVYVTLSRRSTVRRGEWTYSVTAQGGGEYLTARVR